MEYRTQTEPYIDTAGYHRVYVDTDEGTFPLKFDHAPSIAECQAIVTGWALKAADEATAELAACDTQIAQLQAARPVLVANVATARVQVEALVAELEAAPIEEAPIGDMEALEP